MATHVGVLWAGAALLSCRALPPLPAGVCGNGVVESGEDCDRVVDPALGEGTACGREGDGALACRYTCMGGAPCPAGWACRSDDVCHHATGRWDEVAGSSSEWFGDEWSVGDVDGDRVADVVGATGAELRVLKGDGAGLLREALRRPLPRGTAAVPALGDLEDDGRLDVIVPSPQGLVVLRGDAAQTLEPAVFTPFALDAGPVAAWAIPLRVLDRPSHAPVVLRTGPDGGVSMQPWAPTEGFPPAVIEDVSLADLPPRSVVRDLDGDGNDELILAFAGAEEIWKCETYTPVGGGPRRFGPAEVPLGLDPDGEPYRVLNGALLADTDGDGSTDLLVSVRGERVLRLPGNDGGGYGRPELTPIFDSPPGEVGPGWPLTSGQLDGLGPDDFVTPTGVWLTDPEDPDQGLVRADEPFPAGARWRDAVVLDFDGAGLPDIVIADADQPVLHVLRADEDPALRAELPVPTAGLPTLLRRGNLDGDPYDDVAFRDGDAGLSVLFGAGTRPVHAATIDGIARLETGALWYPLESPLDPLDDVVVSTEPDAEGTQRAAVFLGGGSGVLESPLPLLELVTMSTPRAAAAGRFLGSTADGPGRQVIAVAGLERRPELWLVRGLETAPELARVGEVADAFDTHCARWAVGDVDGDDRDELVGLLGSGCELPDRAPAGVRVDVDAPTSVTVEPLAGRPAPGLRMVLLADLDGDHAADLVRATATGVEVDWSDGASLELSTPTLLPPAPDGTAAITALPLQADSDTAMELAVATTASIWLAELGPDRAVAWGLAPIARFGATRLGAGDLDRDGLLDLIAGDSTTLRALRARSHLATSP